MISCGLKAIFWARAVSYANDISNVQQSAGMTMIPYEAVLGSKPNLSHFQPFGIECFVYVREDRRKDRALDARSEQALNEGNATIDDLFCYVSNCPSSRYDCGCHCAKWPSLRCNS